MYRCRRALVEDVPVLVKYRLLMFRNIVNVEDYDWDDLTAFETVWFSEALADERVAAFVAEDQSAGIVAVAALSLYRLTPKPWNTGGRYAYISSMYTEAAHRRRGLARRLVQAALDYAQETGIKNVTLHASPSGRPLYEAFGFKATNEMRLVLPSTSPSRS